MLADKVATGMKPDCTLTIHIFCKMNDFVIQTALVSFPEYSQNWKQGVHYDLLQQATMQDTISPLGCDINLRLWDTRVRAVRNVLECILNFSNQKYLVQRE